MRPTTTQTNQTEDATENGLQIRYVMSSTPVVSKQLMHCSVIYIEWEVQMQAKHCHSKSLPYYTTTNSKMRNEVQSPAQPIHNADERRQNSSSTHDSMVHSFLVASSTLQHAKVRAALGGVQGNNAHSRSQMKHFCVLDTRACEQ
jgi:hypothetical protein